MSREDPLKAEKDFSATLDEQFPIIEKLSDYKTAIDKYLVLEKQTRQSSDLASSKRVLTKIVETLTANDDWALLNDQISLLSKKHGQLKLSIQTLIQAVIDKLPLLDDDKKADLDRKITIIDTIRTVSDKKIFVEVERAVVSKKLAEIYLNKFDDLDKATDILCDLQVETYSLMEFPTKIEYILDQIKLTLRKKDYAQAKILSRKILLKSLKGFEEADHFKLVYLKYVTEIAVFENDYVSIVKHLLLLVEIPLVVQSPEYKLHLVSIVYYIVLAQHDNYQSDLINRIKANPVFAKNVDPHVFKLLETFTTNELIHWSTIEAQYKADYFDKTAIFHNNPTNYANLQTRIVEHNLRIINRYYQVIRMDRLLHLLQLSNKETETYVSDLVNKGMIYAKINRPQGVIKFEKTQADKSKTDNNTNELLNDWAYDIGKLLDEVDSIGHLINKEEMMHGLKQKA